MVKPTSVPLVSFLRLLAALQSTQPGRNLCTYRYMQATGQDGHRAGRLSLVPLVQQRGRFGEATGNGHSR